MGLKIEKIGNKLWRVLEKYYDVPAGFITDGASVPKVFHSFLAPMTGPHAEAAVQHDYAYSLDNQNDLRNRKTIDKLFLKRMLENKTKPWRAYGAYHMVRLFGGSSFRKIHSKQKLIKAYRI